MSATIISTTPSSTTIVRSDEMAARVMQRAIAARKADPFSRDAPPRRDDRHSLSPRGLEALRAGVGHVADVLAWLRDSYGMLGRPAHLALVAEDATLLAVATEVLAALALNPDAFDPGDQANSAPEQPLTLLRLEEGITLSAPPGQHVVLLGPQRLEGRVRVVYDAGDLLMMMGEDLAIAVADMDRLGSVALRLGAGTSILKGDAMRPPPTLLDVVL